MHPSHTVRAVDVLHRMQGTILAAFYGGILKNVFASVGSVETGLAGAIGRSSFWTMILCGDPEFSEWDVGIHP